MDLVGPLTGAEPAIACSDEEPADALVWVPRGVLLQRSQSVRIVGCEHEFSRDRYGEAGRFPGVQREPEAELFAAAGARQATYQGELVTAHVEDDQVPRRVKTFDLLKAPGIAGRLLPCVGVTGGVGAGALLVTDATSDLTSRVFRKMLRFVVVVHDARCSNLRAQQLQQQLRLVDKEEVPEYDGIDDGFR